MADDTISSESSAKSLISSEDRVVIWINPVPLDGGILSHGDRSMSKFSFSHLKKIITYARSKVKHSYPWLSYSVWHHIAKNKLHLSDDISWLYFETFDTVSDVDTKERLKLLNLLTKCSSTDDIERLRRQVCVDTVKFILFLFLQNAPRLSLCAPLVTGEEWPSPETDKKLKSSSDNTHLLFIRSHLHDILQLIAEADGSVTIEGVRGLEFLLLSSIDKQTHLPLSSVVQLPSEQMSNGFIKESKSFSVTYLETWLRSHIMLNPYGSQSMKGGARDKYCPCFRSDVHGRIVSNIVLSPEGSHSLLLHGTTKQTLAKDQKGLDSTMVYIQNCKGSYIYLLGAMKSVVIEKCSRCVIVLGAVERSLIINNCSALCVVAACRRIHISSCGCSVFHLLTMTRPVLFASNSNLVFAPYNTHYQQLESHLDRVGLIANVNCWNNPLCLTLADSSVWSLMDPDNFYTMEIPFIVEGSTLSNPCLLPKEYEEALQERKKRINDWQQTVKEACLSQEKQLQLQRAVQERFKEWLEVTGHQREIYDLGRNVSAKTTKLVKQLHVA